MITPPSQVKPLAKGKTNGSGSGDEEQQQSEASPNPKVDLNVLSAATLRRYKKFFKIQSRQSLNKQQLVEAVLEHFATIPVNEKEILTHFIYTVKTNKNKLDQKLPGLD